MEAFVLKITVVASFILCNITLSESIPLRKRTRSILPDWTSYNSFEPEGPGTYSFGYDIEDPEKDNIQFRDEERHVNGTVRGSYGYLRPDGIVHIVHYTADKGGYRARFENYPRGQLKPLPNPNLLSEELLLSPALVAAMQSKDVYKKQNVHEQHLRPVDRTSQKNYAATSYLFKDNSNYIKNQQPSQVLNNYNANNIRTQYTPPSRLFFNK